MSNDTVVFNTFILILPRLFLFFYLFSFFIYFIILNYGLRKGIHFSWLIALFYNTLDHISSYLSWICFRCWVLPLQPLFLLCNWIESNQQYSLFGCLACGDHLSIGSWLLKPLLSPRACVGWCVVHDERDAAVMGSTNHRLSSNFIYAAVSEHMFPCCLCIH